MFAIIDAAAFQSKNLHNAALYEMRQVFFNERRSLKYQEIEHRMQSHEAYKALPAKVSFLDLDPIPTYKPNDETEYTFSGKRIGRRNRLYRTKDGKVICADVNGSYNILRKSKPDAFADVSAKGLAAYVVQPARLAIPV